jgi:hypothetical protein
MPSPLCYGPPPHYSHLGFHVAVLLFKDFGFFYAHLDGQFGDRTIFQTVVKIDQCQPSTILEVHVVFLGN